MKTCPYCAESIQDQAVVCRFCQRPFPSSAVTIANDAERRRRNLLWLIVIGAILFGVALAGALLVYWAYLGQYGI